MKSSRTFVWSSNWEPDLPTPMNIIMQLPPLLPSLSEPNHRKVGQFTNSHFRKLSRHGKLFSHGKNLIWQTCKRLQIFEFLQFANCKLHRPLRYFVIVILGHHEYLNILLLCKHILSFIYFCSPKVLICWCSELTVSRWTKGWIFKMMHFCFEICFSSETLKIFNFNFYTSKKNFIYKIPK